MLGAMGKGKGWGSPERWRPTRSLGESTLGRVGAEGSRHGVLQPSGHCGQRGEVAGFRLQKGLEGHGTTP